eukprot:1009342-Prorocentrum_minimum.AAC.1
MGTKTSCAIVRQRCCGNSAYGAYEKSGERFLGLVLVQGYLPSGVLRLEFQDDFGGRAVFGNVQTEVHPSSVYYVHWIHCHIPAQGTQVLGLSSFRPYITGRHPKAIDLPVTFTVEAKGFTRNSTARSAHRSALHLHPQSSVVPAGCKKEA